MKKEKILVTDFDGTMTGRDFFRLALEYLPPETALFWDQYKKGETTHFKALASIFLRLRCPESKANELLDKMELDGGVKSACERLEARGWRLVIASAGCLWYIEKILTPLNITAEIHANPGVFTESEGLVMELPVGSLYFSPTIGIDKSRLVQTALGQGIVAFAGDGRPDLGPALLVHSSRRFAKGRLAEELTKRGESFHPFRSWSEMVDKLLDGGPVTRY
ncbi:MAG: HAD-IB family phosphatase [Deltaproteobacteria bacterium]|nr:HAD-IB family phosphatase [Deltaproteobacteria bacterium]